MAKEEVKAPEESVVQAPEAEGADGELQQPESISLQDLQTLLQIVDLSSQRGAFRGAELTQVGAIFDKLNTFLTYVAEQQAAQEETAAGDEGKEDAPETGEE
jgi:hypothetical protein